MLRPVSRTDARKAVTEWHSHHKAHLGELWAIGAYEGERLCGVVVVGRPVAPKLAADGLVLEVTRLCVGPTAPHCTASRLLGAAWRAARAMGCDRMVSYTRHDEAGTCYRAAGWRPVATTPGRPWVTGKEKSTRWLPGFYQPSTEIVDRVRWEVTL